MLIFEQRNNECRKCRQNKKAYKNDIKTYKNIKGKNKKKKKEIITILKSKTQLNVNQKSLYVLYK